MRIVRYARLNGPRGGIADDENLVCGATGSFGCGGIIELSNLVVAEADTKFIGG